MRLIAPVCLTILLSVPLGSAASEPDMDAPAGDDAQQTLERRQRITALEQEVTTLQERIRNRWSDDQRAEEIRALVDEVLADADTRASLRGDDDALGGWDDGFFIRSDDGNFLLEIAGYIQVRYTMSKQRNGPRDNTVGAVESRRTKLTFKGDVGEWEYRITAAFNRLGGRAAIEGPWVKRELNDEWTLQLGRFRSPLLREEMVSSKRQMLAERSLIARGWNQRRTLGLGLQYQKDNFRMRLGVLDSSDALRSAGNYVLAARSEWLLGGKWKRLSDMMSFPDDEPTFALGLGVLYEERERILRTGPDNSLLRWTVDATAEFGGASLFTSFVGNHPDDGEEDFDQFGVVVQAGYFLSEDWQVFARYSWAETNDGMPNLSVVETGFARYFMSNDLKWSTDIGYAFRPISPLWATSGAGWRRDRAGEDGQIVVRTQLQLVF